MPYQWKLTIAGVLAVLWGTIVLRASEYSLLIVIPFLQGCLVCPTHPWW